MDIDAHDVIARYRDRLTAETERAIVTEAQLASALADLAQLRTELDELRGEVDALEHPAADAETRSAA